MDPQTTLGKYRLLEKLGSGGFATVYKAENTNLGNEVALKVMNPHLFQDESTVTRFKQEARFSVQLDHPNIIRVLDLEEADKQLFIVMEYVAGTNLNQLLETNSLLPFAQVIQITQQIAAALDHAHSRHLIHRDVKPSNVLVRSDGVVKLTDFGIVKAVEGTKITQTGTTIGTPAYMSPEQMIGTPVDHRSDLYSLGVVLYEMITGKVPFDGDTPVAIGYKHVHEAPPLASTLHSRARGKLEIILNKALAKKPEDRFQSGAEMAQALVQAVEELEENTFSTAYRQALDLLNKRQYENALTELETLETMQPAYRDVRDLIRKAEQGLQLGDLYGQAVDHLGRGRDLARQILAIDPTFADPAHILTTPDTLTESRLPPHNLLRLVEGFLLIGATLIVASYNGYWRISNPNSDKWSTGIGFLLDDTILPNDASPAEAWIPITIWIPLVCVIILALLSIAQVIWPRFRTVFWDIIKGLFVTITLGLGFILNNEFSNKSTGYNLMLVGILFLWLATVVIPLGVTFLKRK